MNEAFYEQVDDGEQCFVASPSTRGPWSPRFQHGGPPCALLTRAFERLVSNDDLRLARLNFEFLSPVPVSEVTVVARVAKPGRSVELLTAELVARGRTVVQAQAWCVAAVPDEIPDDAVALPGVPAALPGPQEQSRPAEDAAIMQGFLLDSVEWRFVRGDFCEHGPTLAWARLLPALVAGEPISASQRLVALADTTNGLSGVLPVYDWMFMNTDLSVRLMRPPIGEWLCLDTETEMVGGGSAHATAAIHDAHGGLVARAAQSLFVGARSTPVPRPPDWAQRYLGHQVSRQLDRVPAT
ncbi:MAG: thioesterase family protein [Acidothermaceae bacterium]